MGRDYNNIERSHKIEDVGLSVQPVLLDHNWKKLLLLQSWTQTVKEEKKTVLRFSSLQQI